MVGGEVLFHTIFGIGILGNHDVLHEAVQVDFNVGVPARRVEGCMLGIGCVVGIQPVSCLPSIGYAVLVGIETCLATASSEIGLRIALHVAYFVDAAELAGDRAFVGGCTVLGLSHVARVNVVADK